MTVLRVALICLGCMTGGAVAQAVSAILEPFNQVEIRSSVNGRLDLIAVREGDVVAKGAVLASIDARVQRARVALSKITAEETGTLERADITIAQAAALRDRIARARTKGAAQQWEVTQSEQAVQLAEADRKVAVEGQARTKSQLQLDEAILSEFQMTAPFDGTILQVLTEEGEIVDTQMTVLEIGNLDRLRATAFVPLDWLDWLAVGGAVQAEVQGQGGAAAATVLSIDPRIDPASLSVRVQFEFGNDDRALLAGTAVLIDRP